MATHLYLDSMFPGQVRSIWFDGDEPDSTARFLTVTPWKLRDLAVEETLALNFRSFQHMDRTNHAFYSDALKAVGCQAVYHVNRDSVRDPGDLTLDEYPLRDWCRPVARSLEPFDLNVGSSKGQTVKASVYSELLIRH